MTGVPGSVRPINNRRLSLSAPAVAAGVAAALLLLAAMGLLLVWRRVGGAATAALPAGTLLVTAALAGTIATGGRLAWRAAIRDAKRTELARFDAAVQWGGTAALALVAIGCSYPGGRLVDWLIWLPVLGLDSWMGQARGRRRGPRAGESLRDLQALDRADSTRVTCESRRDSPTVAGPIPPLAPPFEGGGPGDFCVLQEVRRLRDEAGVESIAATLRAEFATGQRHATLHVGFCPPLSHLPAVEVETGAGPEAEVRVVQALAHGARLEVRLAEPADEACAVLVELSAAPSPEGSTL